MNVTLHTLVSFATGTALAVRMSHANAARVPALAQRLPRYLPWLAAGLVGNVVLHGLMDVAPHTYPLPWRVDVVVSGAFIVLALAAVRPRYAPVLASAFLGGLLPDLFKPAANPQRTACLASCLVR